MRVLRVCLERCSGGLGNLVEESIFVVFSHYFVNRGLPSRVTKIFPRLCIV